MSIKEVLDCLLDILPEPWRRWIVMPLLVLCVLWKPITVLFKKHSEKQSPDDGDSAKNSADNGGVADIKGDCFSNTQQGNAIGCHTEGVSADVNNAGCVQGDLVNGNKITT